MTERAVHERGRPVRRCGLSDLLLWMLGRRIRVRVSGDSMSPTLRDGDHVLVSPTTHAAVDDVVLCRHPYRRDTRIIKRVSAVDETGMTLTGDNASHSTDSTRFGTVPWSRLIGRVCAQM